MGNSNKKLDELEINLNEEIIRHLSLQKVQKAKKVNPFYRQNRPIE